MAMGRLKRSQDGLWVATSELPRSPGHPFYARLKRALESDGFDTFVGYFEGLDSERGMAWRAADSLTVRSFLGLGLEEPAPDHSTISRTRRLIDVETHREVFGWIQERLARAGLLNGKTIAIDVTTLEANAAMRNIVRRDTGETYQELITKMKDGRTHLAHKAEQALLRAIEESFGRRPRVM